MIIPYMKHFMPENLPGIPAVHFHFFSPENDLKKEKGVPFSDTK